MVGLDYHEGLFLGDVMILMDVTCEQAHKAAVPWESYVNSVMTVKKINKIESGGKRGEKENLIKRCPNNYLSFCI